MIKKQLRIYETFCETNTKIKFKILKKNVIIKYVTFKILKNKLIEKILLKIRKLNK